MELRRCAIFKQGVYHEKRNLLDGRKCVFFSYGLSHMRFSITLISFARS